MSREHGEIVYAGIKRRERATCRCLVLLERATNKFDRVLLRLLPQEMLIFKSSDIVPIRSDMPDHLIALALQQAYIKYYDPFDNYNLTGCYLGVGLQNHDLFLKRISEARMLVDKINSKKQEAILRVFAEHAIIGEFPIGSYRSRLILKKYDSGHYAGMNSVSHYFSLLMRISGKNARKRRTIEDMDINLMESPVKGEYYTDTDGTKVTDVTMI